MTRFLVDHNLEAYVVLLVGTLATLGWLDLVSVGFVTFDQVDLPVNSNDRAVWRFA